MPPHSVGGYGREVWVGDRFRNDGCCRNGDSHALAANGTHHRLGAALDPLNGDGVRHSKRCGGCRHERQRETVCLTFVQDTLYVHGFVHECEKRGCDVVAADIFARL